MVFGKKYAWLQMVMWLGIDQWAWTMNIWHIIKQISGTSYNTTAEIFTSHPLEEGGACQGV